MVRVTLRLSDELYGRVLRLASMRSEQAGRVVSLNKVFAELLVIGFGEVALEMARKETEKEAKKDALGQD